MSPPVRMLARWGVTPVQVTVVGTLGVIVAALTLWPAGHLLAGALTLAFFLLGDGLDGNLARLTGRESRFGAFLDSTLDRAADAAVFAGLAVWGADRDGAVLWLALACLSLGFLVSYARARAEAVGVDASIGLFERTDRLVVALLGVVAVGLGAPGWALALALGIVAAGSAFTVGQRVRAAWLALGR
ncbi:MAG: CDP-alcohol phosphatidyltransferase family protein [Arachnia sp.]